ncbi:MAG: DUF1893 domain-containing protein [Anaerolineae bacterium]|nr:DUF1893 domain-containing protein [Anaerolineae bacterium]
MTEEIPRSDLALARSLLASGDWRFVLVKEAQVIHTSAAPGVRPLAYALQALGPRAAGASLADQIVGRAVALLAAHARLAAVYGQRVSQGAVAELARWHIPLEHGEVVEYILNRAGDGLCPFERRVSTIGDPAEAAAALAVFDPRAAMG